MTLCQSDKLLFTASPIINKRQAEGVGVGGGNGGGRKREPSAKWRLEGDSALPLPYIWDGWVSASSSQLSTAGVKQETPEKAEASYIGLRRAIRSSKTSIMGTAHVQPRKASSGLLISLLQHSVIFMLRVTDIYIYV